MDPVINQARFRFIGRLNDFIAFPYKKSCFGYSFRDSPSVKDAIEALGVPHTEVDRILVNQSAVSFRYQLLNGDDVRVLPPHLSSYRKFNRHLIPRAVKHPVFVVDSHLGKLARNLRLLGIQAVYKKIFPDEEIVRLSQKPRMIVLTRDIGLLKNKVVKRGYWVRSPNPKKQIIEAIREFTLRGKIKPFSLCLECNGQIKPVKKSAIASRLKPLTRRCYNRFFRCSDCGKLYWRGSHYKWLATFVGKWRS